MISIIKQQEKRESIMFNRSFSIWVASLCAIWLMMISARTRVSMFRFPADPGYDLLHQAITTPGIQAFSTKDWPYFYVIPRTVIEVVVLFPLAMHAVILTTLINFIWVACAAVIYLFTHIKTNNIFLSAIAGTVLILSPVAMESSLGSYGNVKWPLTVAAVCWFSSPNLFNRYFKTLLVFTFLVGMSTPMLVFCVAPIMISSSLNYVNKLKSLAVLLIVGLTTFFQLKIAGGLGAASKGWGDNRVFNLNGLGKFWLFGQLWPVALSIGLLLVAVIMRKSKLDNHLEIIGLVVTSLELSGASFYLGGIADRYFVAPLALSSIALVIFFSSFSSKSTFKLRQVKLISLVVVLFLPSLKWFDAGWYLATGPTWHDEVNRAEEECEITMSELINLEISADGSTELECALLKSN